MPHRFSLPILILLCLCLAYTTAWAQQTKGTTTPAWQTGLPADQMQMGTYYYPEHWPASRWDQDLAAIAQHGFTFTHFAEFAWDRLEPTEGQYNFGWLDSALALAAKHKLKVIMCTPSATPPAWLTTKYPEVLAHKQDNQPFVHGARQHASWASERYQSFCIKLATAMGQRYGKDPRVWGWQLDNEPSHYSRYDYGPANQQGFVSWLKVRYTTLEGLNKAWGTAFWSVTYTNWDQVSIPNPAALVQQPNPHAMLDFSRYTGWSIAQFLDKQGQALRSTISPNQWITTNYMGLSGHTHADPAKTTTLQFASFTSYPACGNEGLEAAGQASYRLGNPYTYGMVHDQFRSCFGLTGVMELQPGQTNWGSFNPQPLPGAIRMWLWQSFGQGSRFACNYRFDQPTYGGELHYSAITYPDGKTLRPGGAEWVQTNKEMAAILDKAKPNQQQTRASNNPVGLLAPIENLWNLNHNRLSEQWNTWAHQEKYYRAAKRNNLGVDILTSDVSNWGQYKVIIAPALEITRPEQVKALKDYVQNGGHLVLTCRSLQKDTNGHLLPTAFSAPLADLAGVEVLYYDALPKTAMAKVKSADGQVFSWNNWGEILRPVDSKTSVWAQYANQFYQDKPAATHRSLGKGTVTYVGLDTDDGNLELNLMSKLFAQIKLPTTALPEGLMVYHRNGIKVVINYAEAPASYDIPTGAKVHLGKPGTNVLKQTDILVYAD